MKEIIQDDERRELISAVTNDSAAFLQVHLEQTPPSEIVKKINETIVAIVFGKESPVPSEEEPDLVLGCLWGAQMVREFNWEWVDIQQEEGMDVAVVSPSRDMMIYPFTFVYECISKQRICTVELSFNMLNERKGEEIFEASSYECVMDHIKHIVPPYSLEVMS